ncbi:MAG TPA: hypothetical protein VI168_13900 [Croceibacterium sp.]
MALAVLLAPPAAHACSISIDTQTLGESLDPDAPGIGTREKARREAAMRAGLARAPRAEAAQLRSEARQGLDGGGAVHAAALVASMVPLPVRVERATCGDLTVDTRYPDYRAARAAVAAAAGNAQAPYLEFFASAYAEAIRPCGDEMRRRLADYVAARVEPARLARVWFEVHRLGFDRPGGEGDTLYFLSDGPPADLWPDPSADMIGYDAGWSAPRIERELDARRNEANRARLGRFLAEDADALELAAVLEQGITELGDPALPYGGLCPQTTAPLAEFVARSIERARPLKPRIEVVFEDDPVAGS